MSKLYKIDVAVLKSNLLELRTKSEHVQGIMRTMYDNPEVEMTGVEWFKLARDEGNLTTTMVTDEQFYNSFAWHLNRKHSNLRMFGLVEIEQAGSSKVRNVKAKIDLFEDLETEMLEAAE